MTKIYTAGIRVLLPVIIIASVCGNLAAQTTVQIGYGTTLPSTSLIFPINRVSASTTADFSRGNVLYTVEELAAVGINAGATITKLAWNKGSAGATIATASPIVFELWMRNSGTTAPLSTATTWTSIQATHTQVYNSTTQVIPATVGWIEFTLTTPFVYTGGNIEIASHWDISAVSGNPTTDLFKWEYTTGVDAYAIGNNGTSSAPTTLSSTSSIFKQRPNIQITFTNSACTTPPLAGTAVSSVSTICPNSNFLLSLTGNTMGDGIMFQWQKSSDNVNWLNIQDATNGLLLTNQSSDTYYRAIVSCNGQSDTTTNTLLVTTTLPLSGTYTINSASATAGNNFQTFADLGTRLSCAGVSGPVTVNVQPGTYSGRFVVNTIAGASSTNTITINGNGQTLTNNTAVSADRAAILLNGAQYVKIDNLIIDASKGAYGWGIQLMNAADNNTFTNNIIHSDSLGAASTNYGGIVASGSLTTITTAGNNANYTTITGNTIKGGQHGIIIIGDVGNGFFSTGNVITNNVIRNMGETGIYLEDNNGTQVIGNDISRPTRTQLAFFRGVYITGTTSRNNLIKNNKIHDSHTGNTASTADAYCIYLSGADAPAGEENKIINNLVYKINGGGSQYGVYSSGSDGCYVYHNTIVLDDQTATAGNARGLYQTTAATNVIFRNNISYVTRTGSGVKVAIFFSTTTSTIASNNNVLYVPPATANYHIGSFGSNAAALKTTLADWKSVNSNIYDQASVADNPLFANASLNNYKPTNNLVDGATMNTSAIVDVPDDIFGAFRDPVFPDAGAIEWTSVADDAAITGFVPPSAIPYCSSTLPVVFTLTNAGTSVLNSVDINWTVNSVAQTVVNLSSLSLNPGASTSVTLGTVPVTSNTFYNFSATVSNPNGVADGNAANNTYTYQKWRSALTGTYTIDKTVASSPTNFRSIKGAMDTLKLYGICSAITMNVVSATGPYAEKVTIDSIPGMNSGNAIVLNGNGNTLQYNATSTTNRSDFATITLKTIKYLTINDLIITGLNSGGACGINIINGASYITIDNCTINVPLAGTSESAVSAISTAGNSNYLMGTLPVSSNITISNSTMNGGGIFMVGNFAVAERHSNITLLDNSVYNTPSNYITLLGLQGVTVRGTDIACPGRTPNGTIYGIYVWSGVHGLVVDKNIIHDLPGTSGIYAGIYLSGGTYGTSGAVTNNLMYNWTNTGYQRGIYNNSADSIDIYHNTIVLNDPTYSGNQTTHAYYWALSSLSNKQQNVKNNIFYINRGGTAAKTLFEVSNANNRNNFNAEHNVYWFGSATTGAMRYGVFAGTQYTTFANWQAATFDENIVNADPVFKNPATGNFAPTNGAVEGSVVGTYQVGGITDDIVSVVRTATPDPGAYEIDLPTVATQPDYMSVCIGNNISYTSTSTSIPATTIQWQRSIDGSTWTDIDGTLDGGIYSNFTTSTLNITGATVVNGYIYRSVFTNANGFVASDTVLLTVTSAIDNSTTLAATIGGAQVCASYDVAASNNYMNNCSLIATVQPSGASAVSGNINACVKVDASVQTAPSGEPYVQRHYDILPVSNPTTATSTITLYFKQAEFNAFNIARGLYGALPTGSGDAQGIANLRVTQYNGTGTTPGTYTGSKTIINPNDANITYNATADRWSVTFDAVGSGGFYVHTGNFILPVVLINFKGEQTATINKLSWNTVTEINNKGFELQRSADGRNFSTLGFIATKADNGNSSVTLNYSFDDSKPLASNNYYRLKQVDKDGKYSYSNVILLNRKVSEITLSNVYPNPATKQLNVMIVSPQAEKLTIIVTDLSGKAVLQQLLNIAAGENNTQLNVQHLAQGTYIVKAICANGCETAVQRFVKQ